MPMVMKSKVLWRSWNTPQESVLFSCLPARFKLRKQMSLKGQFLTNPYKKLLTRVSLLLSLLTSIDDTWLLLFYIILLIGALLLRRFYNELQKIPTNLQFVWVTSKCFHVNLSQLWRTDEALSTLLDSLYTYHLIYLASVNLLQSEFWFGWFFVDSHKEDSNMSF